MLAIRSVLTDLGLFNRLFRKIFPKMVCFLPKKSVLWEFGPFFFKFHADFSRESLCESPHGSPCGSNIHEKYNHLIVACPLGSLMGFHWNSFTRILISLNHVCLFGKANRPAKRSLFCLKLVCFWSVFLVKSGLFLVCFMKNVGLFSNCQHC